MSIVDCPGRMVVMVPTEPFRQHQLRTVSRAGAVAAQVGDPERAQLNRVARDRLVADDAVRAARRHGVAVVEVDGSLDADGVADVVAGHFGAYLDGPAATRPDGRD